MTSIILLIRIYQGS